MSYCLPLPSSSTCGKRAAGLSGVMPGCAASGACRYPAKAHRLDGCELAALLFHRLSLVLALVSRHLPGSFRYSGVVASTKLDCRPVQTAPGGAPADVQQPHSLLFLYLGHDQNHPAGPSRVRGKFRAWPVGVGTASSGFAGTLEAAINRGAETAVATALCRMGGEEMNDWQNRLYRFWRAYLVPCLPFVGELVILVILAVALLWPAPFQPNELPATWAALWSDSDQIGRAHVSTPVTVKSRMPSSA